MHPILAHVEAVGAPISLSMQYPDHDADGLPDGPWVLILARCPDSFDIDNELRSLTGVRQLPIKRIDAPLAQNEKRAIERLLRDEGLSPDAVGLTVLDTVDAVIRTFRPAHKGLGRSIIDAAQDFAR